MLQQYRIADLLVAYDAQYPMLRVRSEKYGTYVPGPTHLLTASAERIASAREKTPLLTDEEREYMLIGGDFYRLLTAQDGLMLHASAVVVDEKAYLFSASSGTGKSTHTALWLEYFGKDAYILNDDKPAIRILPDGVFAYGTPFSGKYDISVDRRVPIGGIAFLQRDAKNELTPLPQKEAIYHLLNQTLRPRETQLYTKLLATIERLTEQAAIYTLRCTISREAVETAYNGMRKGTTK